ncbi:c-type cytochrome biogenesis protein CcsB [Blastococcus sp. MG754426]|nr:c-type cytochrome biogenesis protein CcsB [Blastococcus sp. MG754426]MCF6514183.1 c-type cytochrome biogenesis protein CcsB [Blastococcus sp. MG754427]MCF6737310.1 c-type cytochrome biogenesis protein CcsB [Blastococcus sp. KM273129]
MTPDGLSALSDSLFSAAIAVYSVALVAFSAELAFGRRDTLRAERRPSTVARVGAPAPGDEARYAEDPSPARESDASTHRWGLAGLVLTGLGAVLHAGVLITRSAATGRVPWGNMYEFGTASVLVGVVAYLVVAMRVPGVRRIGAFVLGLAVFGLVLIGLYLYAAAGPLIAALRSDWLVVHVSAAIMSFGIFMVSGVASALYLARVRHDKRFPADGPQSTGLAVKLPAAAVLDRVAHRTAIFGFPIWTFAVIAGAIWAESAWGRFWGWDPKETWAFISWALYAAYLHARSTAGWRGQPAAWINLLAFASLVFNLLFVNLVSTGLHSYGGVD